MQTTTAQSLVNVLEAKRVSMVNGMARGRGMGSSRMLARVDAYEDARDSLRSLDWAAWEAYCTKHGYSTSHTAYDFFA